MKSVYRTVVVRDSDGVQITKNVLSQPSGGDSALMVAAAAALADLGVSGVMDMSMWLGDVTVDTTSGSAAGATFYNAQIQHPNGNSITTMALSQATTGPDVSAFQHASDGIESANPTGSIIRSIQRIAVIDLDAS